MSSWEYTFRSQAIRSEKRFSHRLASAQSRRTGPIEETSFFFLYGNVFPAGDVADSRSVDRAVLSVHVPASDPLLDTVVPCGGDIDDHAGVGLFSARFSLEMGIGRGLIIKSPISQCLSVYFSGKCKIFREITVVFLQKKGD